VPVPFLAAALGTQDDSSSGGRRDRKAAERAEAEARFRGTAKQRRARAIEADVERYLDDYRERQEDSARTKLAVLVKPRQALPLWEAGATRADGVAGPAAG
jgi:hypothetical protein